MKLTQKDYEARVARLADGTSPDPDDDRRLVKLYERAGYTLGKSEPAEDASPAVTGDAAPSARRRGTRSL